MLGESRGLTEEEIIELIVKKVRYYYSLHETKFYDYFLTMIRNLNNKNIPMAVVTGGQRERVFTILDEYFKDIFKNAVTIDDVQLGKPHPVPFIKGAEMLDLNPKDCIVVENAPLGIRSAKDAGCMVIAIKTTLSEQFLSEADFIFNTFQGVEEKLFALTGLS